MTKRQQLAEQINGVVKGHQANTIPQHVLISGKEGTGKTFMVEDLSIKLVSYGYQVTKFSYPHCSIVTADGIIDKVGVHNAAGSIILIDDFDKMLRFLPENEQYRLRAFIFKMNSPMLIATSTGLYEGFSDYRTPFYDAFRVFHIPKLEYDDIREILPAEVYEKLEEDKSLWGLMSEFEDNFNYIIPFANAIHKGMGIDVAKNAIIEENTRYYRCLFDSLSNVLQRALNGLAHSGKNAASTDVQRISGLSAANTSSALFRLERQGLVIRVGDKKRNVRYKIKDYFLGMWLSKCNP